jgi:hypothetical protein
LTVEQVDCIDSMSELEKGLLAEKVRQLVHKRINAEMLKNAENATKPTETITAEGQPESELH